jgi:hypothetical protein
MIALCIVASVIALCSIALTYGMMRLRVRPFLASLGVPLVVSSVALLCDFLYLGHVDPFWVMAGAQVAIISYASASLSALVIWSRNR